MSGETVAVTVGRTGVRSRSPQLEKQAPDPRGNEERCRIAQQRSPDGEYHSCDVLRGFLYQLFISRPRQESMPASPFSLPQFRKSFATGPSVLPSRPPSSTFLRTG